MRVLYIDHPEADFLLAQLYRGFVDLVGAENVVDLPRKHSYHGQVQRYPRPWEGGQEGVTGPFAWFASVENREWSFDEVCMRIGEFQLVVLSTRQVAIGTFQTLVERVGRGHLPSVVLADGQDSDDVRWDLCDAVQPHLYFKRELVRGTPRRGHTKILPIAFSSIAVHPCAYLTFDHDVCFLGGANRPGGKAVIEAAVRRVPGNHLLGHVGYEEYVRRVQRSKIVVVPRGCGCDTLRFWETLATEGPMLVSDRLPLDRHQAPEDGVHCGYFDGPEHLESLLRHYLDHEDDRRRIAAAGFKHFLAHHTPVERARYVLREGGYSDAAQ